MKRFLVLVVVGVITIAVLFFFTNPEFLDKIWLWIIGFIGYVLVLLEKGLGIIKEAFKKDEKTMPPLSNDNVQKLGTHIKHLEEKIIQIEQNLNAIRQKSTQ